MVSSPSKTKSPSLSQKLIFSGSTVWDLIGRMKNKIKGIVPPTKEELVDLEALVPKIYGPAAHLDLVKAVTHCSAFHAILIDGKIDFNQVNGVAYTFGRNDKHQLGDSKTTARSDPFAIELDEKVVDAACAKGHSILLTESGKVYGAGNNSNFEAIGVSSKDQDVAKFTLVKGLEDVKVVQVAAGIDFSMALAEDGKVYAWGCPQYGQLGTTGSDHEYIGPKKKVYYTSQSVKPVKFEGSVVIKSISCGFSHTFALDSEGDIWAWGCAGYSRLGLNGITKDVMTPQKLSGFTDRKNPAKKVAAGPTAGMAIDSNDAVQLWGKWKNTGDGGQGTPWMYPKYFQGLSGWKVRDVSLGEKSLFCIAETSTISWGQNCSHGELGLDQVKSATNAVKVQTLEGIFVNSVSCGYGNTLMLVDSAEPQLKDLETIGKRVAVSESLKRKGESDEASSPKKAKGEVSSPKKKAAGGSSPTKQKA